MRSRDDAFAKLHVIFQKNAEVMEQKFYNAAAADY